MRSLNKAIWIRHSLLILLILSTGGVGAQQSWSDFIPKDLDAAMDISVLVQRVSDRQVLFEHHADRARISASLQKLPTVVAAHAHGISNHRFTTTVTIRGRIDAGELCGDILIRGDGDPTLGSEKYGGVPLSRISQDVIRALDSLGVHAIQGNIFLIDHESSPRPGRQGTHLLEDVANYYGAGYYALNVKENAFDIMLDRYQGLASVSSFDSLAADAVNAHDVRVSGRSDLAYVYDGRATMTYDIYGSVPEGKGVFRIKGAMRSPADYLGRYFIKVIQQRGIAVAGYKVTDQPMVAADDVRWSSSYRSPSVSALYRPILHKSHNLFAEAVYQTLPDMARDEEAWLSPSRDGSGLSAGVSWTARELNQVIIEAVRKDDGDFLSSNLPRNGREGTVSRVLADHSGTLWMKSGSKRGVLNYAGIHPTADGDWIAFVLMANSRDQSRRDLKSLWTPILRRIAEL